MLAERRQPEPANTNAVFQNFTSVNVLTSVLIGADGCLAACMLAEMQAQQGAPWQEASLQTVCRPDQRAAGMREGIRLTKTDTRSRCSPASCAEAAPCPPQRRPVTECSTLTVVGRPEELPLLSLMQLPLTKPFHQT